jgi:hypothetical protein
MQTDSLRYINRQFDAAFNVERVQLAVYCFKERFGFGELFDCYDVRVERGGGLEWARNGKAKADLVTARCRGAFRRVATRRGNGPQECTDAKSRRAREE